MNRIGTRMSVASFFTQKKGTRLFTHLAESKGLREVSALRGGWDRPGNRFFVLLSAYILKGKVSGWTPGCSSGYKYSRHLHRHAAN